MKKTIKINISGSIFHLDEDAYTQLNSYLDQVHAHFESSPGGNEIIRDIELRIAELFQFKLTELKQVISLADVNEIIEKLGNVEDFDDEEGDNKNVSTSSRKKLYRDPDRAIFGGVAAGLASYVNTDPAWIRLIFVILLLGYGVIGLIYILLWLMIPKAETYAQKLEMKGESISISDIEEKVKKEYEEVRSNLNQVRDSNGYKTFAKGLNEIFTVAGNIFKALFKFVLVLIGVSLIIAGIAISLSVLGVTMTNLPINWQIFPAWDVYPFMLMFHSFFDPTTTLLIITATTLIILIPVLLLIYLIFRIIGYKGKDRAIYLTGTLLWIFSVITLMGIGLLQLKEFSSNITKETSEPLIIKEKSPLIIEMSDTFQPEYFIEGMGFDDEMTVSAIDEHGRLYGSPRITIEQADDNKFLLEIRKSSRGASYRKAAALANQTEYNWRLKDNLLVLDSYYRIGKEDQFRLQKVLITLKIPEGESIIISEETEPYLDEIDNDQNFWSSDMGSKKWKMSEKQLLLQKKE